MRYICGICGYIYDEEKEKVPFSKLPEDWVCPLCGASKAEFEPEKSDITKEEEPSKAPEEKPMGENEAPKKESEGLQKLSPAKLSAVFSNLSYGSEKQYKVEEAKLFKKLADYFGGLAKSSAPESVQALSDDLLKDIESYKALHKAILEAGDRGAERALIWGEKVTKMLSSIVKRYLREGEAMLEDTEIWVCGACGFVYIGKEPPKLCPVCKVPSWRFKKIERGGVA